MDKNSQAPPNVLGKNPSMATCPSCGVRRQTVVDYESSTKTHLVALLICLVGGICCCCIPYCKNSCKTAKHSCSSCGAYVGTYKN
nr:lipopolysaccharide-induced tumor necrosis factor-alpha factor homolog isoform X1 [Drosophila suzukii]